MYGCGMLAQPGTSLCYRFSNDPQYLHTLHPMHPDNLLKAVSALLATQVGRVAALVRLCVESSER